MQFFKSIRPGNLLMILVTQYAVRHTVVLPILSARGMESSISHFYFSCIVCSTLLIAAAGYIINDYYDYEIDQVNKKGKGYPGNGAKNEKSLLQFLILALAGVSIGTYLNFKAGIPMVWIIHIFSVVVLYGYSSVLKKIFFAGNLSIAILTSLSLLIVLLPDRNAFQQDVIRNIVFAYAFFAFFMTLIREIIKDLEDREGDRIQNRKTIPLVLGETASKVIAGLFLFVVIASITRVQWQQQQWTDLLPFLYVVVLIQLPCILLLVRIIQSRTRRQYHQNSFISKLIMLAGIGSMPVFYLML